MNFFCFSIFLVSPSFIIPPASNQPSLLSRYIFSFRSDPLTPLLAYFSYFSYSHATSSRAPLGPGGGRGGPGFGGGGMVGIRTILELGGVWVRRSMNFFLNQKGKEPGPKTGEGIPSWEDRGVLGERSNRPF